jgi:hypothetical protein
MPVDSSAEPYSEKRRLYRARRLRKARCMFNNGASSLDVTLRDISPAGARILGHELIWLPDTFELQILDADGVYSSRLARLRWRRGNVAGVEFVD